MEQDILDVMKGIESEAKLERIKIIYKNSSPIIRYYIWCRLRKEGVDTRWIF